MKLNPKIDQKNIQLLKLLAQLRDHIDIHRIIGLNVAHFGKVQSVRRCLGISVISARKATRRERKEYEEAKK